jgi:hypothetical protein
MVRPSFRTLLMAVGRAALLLARLNSARQAAIALADKSRAPHDTGSKPVAGEQRRHDSPSTLPSGAGQLPFSRQGKNHLLKNHLLKNHLL